MTHQKRPPVSRHFYEELLGQSLMMDNGPNVIYEGGFSLWQRDAALGIIFEGTKPQAVQKVPPVMELYFESPNLQEAWERYSVSPDRIIHPIIEHPWGQEGFRIYDPDGFIVDISEPLPVMVRRFLQQGYSLVEIAEKYGMEESLVRSLAEQSE